MISYNESSIRSILRKCNGRTPVQPEEIKNLVEFCFQMFLKIEVLENGNSIRARDVDSLESKIENLEKKLRETERQLDQKIRNLK